MPPDQAIATVLGEKVDRYVPKPPGTTEQLHLWYGPYAVPPGHDSNRFDLELPLRNGFVTTIEPAVRRVSDLSVPSRQEAHLHHAHWLGLDPGNRNDQYTGGLTRWQWGTGDEMTRADSTERSAAEPGGPIYGGYVSATQPQILVYMIHNKTSQPLAAWIELDVTFVHGSKAELAAIGGRPYHDVTGVFFGRTFNVPRRPRGDGVFVTSRDAKPIEWTSTVTGTMIGAGAHLHPGALRAVVENLGSREHPCPDDHKGYGGTTLLRADALWRGGVPFSEDFQIEVTHPAWRAPIRKGDRLRVTGIYENREHAWYDVMTHAGTYVDEAQPPRPGCRPYLVGGVQERRTVVRRRRHVRYSITRSGKLRRRVRWRRYRVTTGVDPIAGVANRPWSHHPDPVCGVAGAPACDRPETPRRPGPFADTVTISSFRYLPGDRTVPGEQGDPPRVHRGQSLRFVNADQQTGIRHSVTTCALPCNGPYVANYPLADGVWDSGILGWDLVSGGNPLPVARTPPTLPAGRYAYFCRIHPWMRGAFEVVR